MSEEEIIKYLKNVIKTIQESDMLFDEPANIRCGIKMKGAIQGLLDLYNKEKEKNKNSISKDKIRKDLETCQKVYEKEMKPYQRDYGLDVTYLSKKEKEELVNKRNCLITQMKTYEMLLEE